MGLKSRNGINQFHYVVPHVNTSACFQNPIPPQEEESRSFPFAFPPRPHFSPSAARQRPCSTTPRLLPLISPSPSELEIVLFPSNRPDSSSQFKVKTLASSEYLHNLTRPLLSDQVGGVKTMAVATSLSAFNLLPSLEKQSSSYLGSRRAILPISTLFAIQKRSRYHLDQQAVVLFSRHVVRAATEGSAKSSQSDEKIPSWAKPDTDEPPPWARDGGGNGSSPQSTFEIPFYVYLLASALTAIAAIGSVFEYVNQKPVFGVLNSDSVFYAPLLGFFAFTGIPSAAFLWYKSVQVANKEAEEQDRRDGYL